MAADAVLVLAGLVLAHLVADFLLQTHGVVSDKAAPGRRAMRGLGLHGLGVAVCLVPFVALFGLPGLWTLIVITATHVVIDRWKALATRRAEARALATAHARRATGAASPVALGPAWTPAPAGLFVLDQAAHAAVLGGAWAVWLAGAVPLSGATAAVNAAIGGWDRDVVHEVALTALVVVSLVIVNVRAGALFVAILVHPRRAGCRVPAGGSASGRSRPSPSRSRRGPCRLSRRGTTATRRRRGWGRRSESSSGCSSPRSC